MSYLRHVLHRIGGRDVINGGRLHTKCRPHSEQTNAYYLVAIAGRRVTGPIPGGFVAALIALALANSVRAAETELPQATLTDGRTVTGHPQVVDGRLVLRTQLAGFAVPGAQIRTLRLPKAHVPRAPGLPLLRIFLRDGGRVTGTVPLRDEQDATLRLFGDREVNVPWNALAGFANRPGSALVLHDGFETGTDAWKPRVTVSPERPLGGKQSLKIAARQQTLVRKLPMLPGGELECSFYDPGDSATGYSWELTVAFHKESLSAILGWEQDSYTVRASDSLNVAVQRLRRAAGWHRLRIQFRDDGLRVQVDGALLAHGKQPAAALNELQISTAAPRTGKAPPAGYLDDLKLYRQAVDRGPLDRQYEQDVVFLASGDEVYGRVDATTSTSLSMSGRFGHAEYPLSEVQRVALAYRRPPLALTRGQRVRVRFMSHEPSAGSESDPQLDTLRGVLTEWSDKQVVLKHAWLGPVVLPPEWLVDVQPLGYGARLELDPGAHHLGNEARPEFRVIEAAGPQLEIPFDLPLARLPQGTTYLSLVAVDLEGKDSAHAADLAAGNLRTQVFLNDRLLEDQLNRHVRDSRQFLRLPIPQGILRDGKNVLRIVQKPAADDLKQFDDCSIEQIALEIDEE